MKKFWPLLLSLVACLCLSEARSETAQQIEERAAWTAAAQAGLEGPTDIALIDQATLSLPKSLFYIPEMQAARVLKAMGNVPPPGLVGLVMGTGKTDDWMVAIRYVKQGFIKDDDAKEWNADQLLSSIRERTEEANKQRALRGFAEMEIIGWSERPNYDARTHRLVWAIMTKDKGFSDLNNGSANYNTYALGREGYFSLNLITSNQALPTQKPIASYLLGSLAYNVGKRYEDFVASTDHMAEYGLAALIGGVAVKKAGWLALMAAFFAKSAKAAVLIAGAAIFGLFKAITGVFRKRAAPQTPQQ